MHSLSAFFNHIHFIYYNPLSFLGSLTFIICEWRYDTVQQWALCVFSVQNVCEHWPAAEWEEIWMDFCVYCVGMLKTIVRQDKEYSMYWGFHIT